MNPPQPKNHPRKASVTRDSDVRKSLFPVTTRSQLAVTLSETHPAGEVNQEIRSLVLGLSYLKSARQQLIAARRFAKTPPAPYADRIKEVVGLIEHVEKQWPLEVV